MESGLFFLSAAIFMIAVIYEPYLARYLDLLQMGCFQ